MKTSFKPIHGLTLLCGVTLLCGCHSIGPMTVARDRFDYSSAITESWKRQTLLNIVKLRYLDPPIFVDVGQIVSGYSLATGASIGGTLASENGVNNMMLGGAATFTDRPTVTYTPLTGSKFVRALITPIPPESLFSTLQAGWPADAMMLTGIASINGLKNQQASISGVAAADDGFLRAIQLMRKIQLSDAVGVRVVQGTNKDESTLVSFHAQNISPETLADIRELHELLHLAPDAQEFKLVFGSTPANDRELAVVTRSMLHIMNSMASQVDVPPQDIAEGRTTPGWNALSPTAEQRRLIRIHSAKSEPSDCFVAVPYRQHWYWIDDRDMKSKRMFSLIMLLFTLGDNSEPAGAPVLTIPAQ
ncbi:MAG TPA: hypothetical protein VGO57_14870 [Verrucomicrobiae bacterium]|jgi:hypothetical protein